MSLFSWFNSADQVDTALVVVAIIGAIIEVGVAVAAVINVHKELEEARKEKLEKYIEVFACVAAFFFLAEAILGCRSSALLGIQVEKLREGNLVLQTNVASLNRAVIQLAHQYDLSTNALAEANARLALIKPLKERLIDCLNLIAPEILAALKTTPKGEWLPVRCGADSPQAAELENLCREPSAGEYIENFKLEPGLTVKSNGRFSSNIDFDLNPRLLQ